MPFKKGQSGNPRGRKVGTPNKATAALKEMILGALGDAGGQSYLVTCARENPTAFLALVGKVLPMTIGPGDSGSGELIIRWHETPSA